ncbi:MAG: AGE family epimerase/isomerase [Chitinophagaceae bacterium]|nr:AGE family epimerase/isomerase [Chitinophagaceae bacterium]
MEEHAHLSSEFRQELQHILDYWEKFTIDRPQGGFYGRLTDDNQVVEGAVKGAVLNARILWSFSAAYNLTKEAHLLEVAERSFDYISTHFLDLAFGGVYWSVTAEGIPADMKKQMYAIAFTIYGLTEYYRASPAPEVLDMARALYRDIEDNSYDTFRGGYMEALTYDWKPMDDQRLSDKDANEKKTMNTHLHILEAYTNLYRVWGDAALAEKIKALIGNFTDHIVDRQTHHLHLFFDEDWSVRSNIISYGHDIEASWLLLEAAEVLGDQALIRQVKELVIKIAVASMEGLDPDGSMSYELDEGRLIAERHWWVQAEAMVGLLNVWQLTGEESFYQKFRAVWEYIKRYIIDGEKGEWFWGRTAEGAVMPGQDKVGFWKCPYHNTRACIEVIRRLKEKK